MDTDISDWAGTGSGVGTDVDAITVVDAEVDVEVNPYADIDAALVIDTHVCRCRSIFMAIY